jgi:hypothetical protein
VRASLASDYRLSKSSKPAPFSEEEQQQELLQQQEPLQLLLGNARSGTE